MTRNASTMLLGSLLCLLAGTVTQAYAQLPPSLQGVGFEQRLNEQVPLDIEFRDDAGQAVQLGDYFADKPVILVLVQYRCPMLCTEVLNGLVKALLDVPLLVGKDFYVVTVSFDARENPELAAAKKKTYLERYGRSEAESGWHFLTGQQDAIDRLTQAVGFRYRYDPKTDRFAHASGIMVLTPSGKIARYFYDISYNPRDVRLALVEASQGKIGSPVDQILLYCFHYDPNEGKYGPAVMNLLRAGGVLTVLGIGGLVGLLSWQNHRKAKRGKASGRAADG